MTYIEDMDIYIEGLIGAAAVDTGEMVNWHTLHEDRAFRPFALWRFAQGYVTITAPTRAMVGHVRLLPPGDLWQIQASGHMLYTEGK